MPTAETGPWIVLAVTVGAMLALDLLVLNRDPKPVRFRHAAAWSAVWISVALAFGGFVAVSRGSQAGGEYLAGYLVELSLSVDNVFVFALIFAAFAVPAAYQHRLLFWGILGAIVFRAVFIGAGTAVLAAAHWAIYLLGILLVVTGIRLARSRGHAVEPHRNPVLRMFRRFVPMTDGAAGDDGAAFLVRRDGRLLATPLLAVLVVIETTDIMFALDSIPAVFAVTTDPFIVFSSNLFAILGLRALYFLLAGLLDRFVYLKVGLAALLVFAGAKILVGSVYDIPIAASLAIIVAILGTAIGASIVATHSRRSVIVPAMARIGAGTVLGVGMVGWFAAVAWLRDAGLAWDAGLTWVAVDGVLIAAVTFAIVVGLVLLRRLHARSALVRSWVTVGAAFVVLLALLIGLD